MLVSCCCFFFFNFLLPYMHFPLVYRTVADLASTLRYYQTKKPLTCALARQCPILPISHLYIQYPFIICIMIVMVTRVHFYSFLFLFVWIERPEEKEMRIEAQFQLWGKVSHHKHNCTAIYFLLSSGWARTLNINCAVVSIYIVLNKWKSSNRTKCLSRRIMANSKIYESYKSQWFGCSIFFIVLWSKSCFYYHCCSC